MNASEAGRRLAARHASLGATQDVSLAVDRGQSLLNFSEVTYDGDWSLRSALCRLAQPEPVRVGRILQSIRRLEVVLHHAQQALERHAASCTRPTASLVAALDARSDESTATYPDVRAADLARLVQSGLDAAELLSGYVAVDGIDPLSDEERVAVPLLAVAARFEELADLLTSWADQGPANRPNKAFDEACDEIETSLDELEVPHESGRPPRGSRSRRS